MRTRAPGPSLVLALALALASCAPAGPRPDAPPPFSPSVAATLDAEGARWVDETLASLSLEEAVGQLIFPWLAGGYTAEDHPDFLEAAEWVERWGIGGVAISIGTPHSYVAKLNALQRRARVPLLVTSDFENGGPGMRINHSYALPSLLAQGGGTSFPPTMAFGAIGDPDVVTRFARVTAREARAVGVHVNFAPVLDVNSNPENPIINTRAFGEEPATVALLGRAYIRGAREGGVLATAKHFPGHGDTRVDSHLELPEVTADRARLDAVELVPFRAAVEEGVDAVMTAHVSVPEVLGPGAPPATLSPEFMTGLLRDEMGFAGLLFTDALRMGAITDGYGAGEAAVLSLEAGSDVILVPASVSGAAESIVAAVSEGRVSRERVDASVRRILEAKARVGLHRERLVSLEAVSRSVGVAEHLDFADEVATRSITLPRDRDELVPLDHRRTGRILSITYAESSDLPAGREFDATLAALLPGVEGVRIEPDARADELTELLDRTRAADVVLVNAYVPPRAGAGTVALSPAVQEFVGALVQRRPTVLTSFGNPYLLAAVPEVGSYLVAWGDREVSQRAAARALAGATPISGRLPITLPGLHALGEGLEREADPVMAARVGRRGDALDETGLLLRPDDPDILPQPDTVRRLGDDRPAIPLPPAGHPAPGTWRSLPISPLEAEPATVGMDADALDALDDYILRAIADSVSPGAALAVLRRGQVVRLRGYGTTDWGEGSPAVTPFTIYDLASLTKVMGTTTAIQLLVEEGRLSLDDPVVRHLPGWDRGDQRKVRVTVRDLLLHRAGLPPFRQFFRELEGEEAIRDAVYDLPLDAAPRTTTAYSDIGFKTLAWIVEAASGQRLDAFLEARVWRPLGMSDTGFLPDAGERPRIAPTERDTEWRPYHIHGEVHDENAHALGGVAGHAGLFSTAQDMAAFVQALMNRGMISPCGHRPGSGEACGASSRPLEVRWMAPGTVESFTKRADPTASRALGWDTPSGRSSAGDYFSAASFGHTGYTGPSIWVDPELELAVVLLTNRVNPTRENTRHIPFRRVVHDAVANAVVDAPVRVREP